MRMQNLAGATMLVAASVIAATRAHFVSSAAPRPAAAPARRAVARWDSAVTLAAQQMIDEGRATFRFATFGDEAFWSDGLGLDKAITGAKHGGVGAGVSPKAALSLGLKVDMDALPASVVEAVKAGKVDMNDPATTLTLIKLNA